MEYEYHEFANDYPLMDEDAFGRFCENVQRHGLAKEIVLYEGKILDGRDRYRCCKVTGTPPKFTEFTGTRLEAFDFVTRENDARKHLTPSQLAMVEGRRTLRRQELLANGEQLPEESPNGHASPRSVASAVKVLTQAAPEIVRAVERGEVAVSDAEHIVGASAHKQRQALKKVQAGKAKTLRSALAQPSYDKEHNPVPAKLADAFGDQWIVEGKAILTRMIEKAKSCQSWNPWLKLGELIPCLEDARSSMDDAEPFVVCDKCSGKGCHECRQCGWMPEWRKKEIDEE